MRRQPSTNNSTTLRSWPLSVEFKPFTEAKLLFPFLFPFPFLFHCSSSSSSSSSCSVLRWAGQSTRKGSGLRRDGGMHEAELFMVVVPLA
jgi:hypothetical protein